MKRLLVLAMVLVMFLSLAACGGTAKTTTAATAVEATIAATTAAATAATTAATTAASGPFELALITYTGNIEDKLISETAWNSVENYAEKNNISYASYRPSEDSTAAREESIGTAVDKGAKIVVCYGYLFEEAIYNVQDKYPDVQFLLLGGEPHAAGYAAFKTSTNVHCILYKEEEAGYLAGYAVVMDGYTKLGFLGASPGDSDIVNYEYGYQQGAEAAAKELGLEAGDVTMKCWFSNNYLPNDDIKTKMSGWYTDGTEVVFSCGGSIYLSATAAAEAAGGKVIGVDVDQSAQSATIITSAINELATSVDLALTSIYANGGKWNADSAGITATLGAAENCVGLPTAEASWKFTTFAVDQYKAVFAKLADKTIAVDNTRLYDFNETYVTLELITVDYVE